MSTAIEELEEQEVASDATEQSEPVAEAPAAIPPEPPADCPEHIRAHYDQIREKERSVYALESEYLDLKEQAATAKKEFEQADKALRNLIARGADPQRELPFGKSAFGESLGPRTPKRVKLVRAVGLLTVDSEYQVDVDANGDVSAIVSDPSGSMNDARVELEPEDFEVIEWTDPAPPAADNDAWRTAPFAELGLTAKQNDLFAGAGIDTIGDLEDLRARIAENKPDAQWPKGIGPAKVTDIENRIVNWLDKNRDKFGEPVQATEAATAVDEPIIPEPEAEPDALFPIHKPKATNGKAKAKHKANGKAKAKKKGRR